ncbi:MAG: hypothetical protein COV72_01525 [Candidatus Omnitrophica bacterium CG11_big_fil_rev_8_21_14_0_20_42_13]|uniref:Putative zinc-finger domain-containing protein n=1 Tax=Candidatus Ghiorseimicrobium undicola TaxID=1974746 RepID=A0A2H0M201_9BACT|nr:MAG: hypothetical protein COV72_01525 [Candidatus Omnitrophica bacterium CG11_big_fil_rev_8_21_14_0_20_42_13]
MNCGRIEELLKTDYIDNELDEKTRLLIKEHLSACRKCAGLEAQLREKIIAPFKAVEKYHPPEYLWQNIKDGIAPGVEKFPLTEGISIADRILIILRALKPAYLVPVLAAVVVIAVLLSSPLKNNGGLDSYIAEQSEFIIDNNGDAINANGLGTSIEEYFLS